MLLVLPAIALAQPGTNAAATELLNKGSQLVATQPAEAVKVLQEALRQDPGRSEIHYQLGLAFHAIGDLADAEAEFREVLSRVPDSTPAHNYLGIVLFEFGNARAAAEEFRSAVRLAPNDPNAHFNLGEALASTGDVTSAEELRKAASLAPGDAVLTRVAKAASQPITVDVRQVLVPVVVTDQQGHSITGLVVQYEPGGKSDAHHHAGSVMAYILTGAIRSQNSATGAVRVYKAGESFFEPAGSIHLVSENASTTEPASLLAIFIAEDGATLTMPGK